MPTAAAATVRSSTKWRTCGASIAARSDTATADRRPSVRQNRYAITGNVAAMARSADVVPTGRPPSTSSALQSNEYYFARARVRDKRRRAGDRRAGWRGGGRDEPEWQPSLTVDCHPIETLHYGVGGGCTVTWGKRPHRDDPSPHAARIVK